MPRSSPLVLDRALLDARDYWTGRLSPYFPTERLPLGSSEAGGTRRAAPIRIAGERAERLLAVTRGSPFLTYVVVLAGVDVCLSWHTRCDRVVVGSPPRSGGADDPNLLLIAQTLGTQRASELLVEVRTALIEAYARQVYPIDRLLNDLGLADAQEAGWPVDVVVGMEGLHSAAPPPAPVLDVRLASPDGTGGVSGTVGFPAEGVPRRTVERFVDLLGRALDGLLEDLDRPVRDIPLATEEERRRMAQWNAAPSFPPEIRPVPATFEAVVALHGAEPALRHGGGSHTYAELDRLSNRMARRLRALGVEPESRVGLCLPPADYATAVLAVWKAGGAFVPLDPTYPPARLEFMVRDARLTLLVRGQGTEALAALDVRSVSWRDWRSESTAEADDPLEPVTGPDHLAYVIYTSGSTGRPKGALVPHRGLAAIAAAQRRMFGLGPGDRVLQFASPSFDASVFEILNALLSGACLVVPETDPLPGPDLLRILEEEGITAVTLPPSTLALLPDAPLPRLRLLTVAGEACGPNVVARWGAGRRLFNLYGPTETTIWATASRCRPDGSQPTIGQPVGHVRVHVLDVRGREVPAGLLGELHIGGVGVARGYTGRSGLTAARFVPDPFATAPGSRLYRTGDLVRRREDGDLEFLGRVDDQVKVRGYRIEPREIESALEEHPDLAAAVVQRVGEGASARLVAWVVPFRGTERPETGALRAFLLERLPPWMTPSAFRFVVTIPRTPGGKLDRARLAELESGDTGPDATFVAPRTGTESLIAAVWASLLGLERVGVHDNFFELGGHSLLATQVVSRVTREAGVDFKLRELYLRPTVAAMAEVVDGLRSPVAGSCPEGDAPEPASPPTPDIVRADVDVDTLSDDEVAALLSTLDAGEERV